ncbi:major facilitator superfamily domain-containing protein [Pyrenochaeta sp. MPI-SDFR-AT-0127]|nr:major facilitator superfamily domain-containing protein [Pyrenochaeta sp. MPI-SDFR-AT-0127]
MSKNVTIDTGDGQEFIIEVKVRPRGSANRIPSATHHEEVPLHLDVSANRRSKNRSTVYQDPPESDLGGFLGPPSWAEATRRPSLPYNGRRRTTYLDPPESDLDGYLSQPELEIRRAPFARNLRRTESTAARMSKRLSRASEAFVATAEFNGWGDPVQPFRRTDDIELEERPVTTRISRNPDGSLRINAPDELSKTPTPQYGMKFYLILFALSMTNILVAFEGTVVSTALPTIVRELGGGSSYVWVSSGYFLASTVLQPLYGQLADIFGRRNLILFATVAFVVGSGISGGAPDMSIMILGRVIQGVGGGGINMLVNLIVCDLVPLRDRGKWMAVIFAAISIGTGLGPFLGGVIVQSTTWRWVFLLNLPVGVLALGLLVVFLKIKTPKSTGTWREKLARLDLGGNFIFIISVSMILVALAYAGTLWAWDGYSAVATLLFGFFGMVVFVFYEESNYCPYPTIPLRLFRNRTSAAAFAITFIHSMLTLLVIYFLPVYFQGVLLSTPTRSGVQMLPTVIVLVPFSAISGALLSKFGRYKPFHIAGFLVITVGLGSFITLDRNSSMAAWVMVQFTVAVGSGFSLSTLLPAVQAKLSDNDTAAATATWAFIRQFGVVWGVSVPAAIFNSRVETLLPRISSMAVRAALDNGAAYDHGTKEYISQFQNPLRGEIISVYEDSLQLVWIFATAIAGLGFLLVFLEEEVSLRTENNNDFGLDKQD